MNSNIKIFFMLFILVIPLAAQSVFKIKLHISKSTYIVGEPVEIGISFTNMSNMIIEDQPLGYTELELTDEYGQKVKRGGWASTFWGPYNNKLSPGREVYYIYVLNEYYGNDFPGLMARETI